MNKPSYLDTLGTEAPEVDAAFQIARSEASADGLIEIQELTPEALRTPGIVSENDILMFHRAAERDLNLGEATTLSSHVASVEFDPQSNGQVILRILINGTYNNHKEPAKRVTGSVNLGGGKIEIGVITQGGESGFYFHAPSEPIRIYLRKPLRASHHTGPLATDLTALPEPPYMLDPFEDIVPKASVDHTPEDFQFETGSGVDDLLKRKS